jgi:hypothetical protein
MRAPDRRAANRAFRRERFHELLVMIVIAGLIAPWGAVVWQLATGTTPPSSSHSGRNATPRDFANAREKAVIATLVVAPVGVWLLIRKRPKP